VKPRGIAKTHRAFQIVDTPESSETIINTGLPGTQGLTNRTVVGRDTYFPITAESQTLSPPPPT
jgi:hypothetical protein